MSSTIIDETVILRYLLDDDEVLSPRAAKVIATRTARVYPETHMDFTDCLLAARTAIYNDDVVSFGKPIIQGMIDYRRKRQTAADARDRAAEARSRSTDATIDKLRHHGRH